MCVTPEHRTECEELGHRHLLYAASGICRKPTSAQARRSGITKAGNGQPALDSLARLNTSRRFVFTRSPAFGMREGAATALVAKVLISARAHIPWPRLVTERQLLFINDLLEHLPF
jgi:hypothetical protein